MKAKVEEMKEVVALLAKTEEEVFLNSFFYDQHAIANLQGKEKDQNLTELAAELDSTRDKLAEV